jgi:RNA polymerase sigma-70 factor (ECF subfamily)
MAQESTSLWLDSFYAQHAHLIDWLHTEANCARWELSRRSFAEVLRRSVEKRFRGARVTDSEVEAYLKSLHLQDLALACSCSEGLEAAWEFFIAHFRQELRSAARAILRTSGSGDEVRAAELADSLYAELYGVNPSGSVRRKSLFEYFHGRSKLSTWLRAVLAQRHVDLLRSGRRTISLDDDEEGKQPRGFPQHTDSAPPDPDRERYLARIDDALSGALAGRTPCERMVLAFYYIDRLTLAEVGRALGEHESTVSRQLDRIRRELREAVTQALLRGVPARDGCAPEPGLDEAQVELAFEYALEDWPFDLSRALSKGETAADPPEK